MSKTQSILALPVAFMLLNSPTEAATPIDQAILSKNGQIVLSTPAGKRVLHALYNKAGKPVCTRLLRTVSTGDFPAISQELAVRFERIESRFAQEVPTKPEIFSNEFDKFSDENALSDSETQLLVKLAKQEFDVAFTQSLPLLPKKSEKNPLSASTSTRITAPLGPSLSLKKLNAIHEGYQKRAIYDKVSPGDEVRSALVSLIQELRKNGENADFFKYFPVAQIAELVMDLKNFTAFENIKSFFSRLMKVMKLVEHTTKNQAPFESRLKAAISETLQDAVPISSIPGRIEMLFKNPGSLAAIHRALGEMTFKESRQLTYGHDPLHPSPESLLGRYLAETQAATLIRTFNKGPGKNKQSVPRLVVAVSEETLPVFLKYFSRETFLGQFHTPNQGHFYLTYGGQVGDSARMSGPLRSPRQGTIIPMIVLSTREGQRVDQFFYLGRFNSSIAKTPWILSGYCAMGGYSSCTHWFGNIPLGDRLVLKYGFPGSVDQYASNNVPETPRIKKLKPYQNPADPHAYSVWKVPGHQQLHEVLGLEKQQYAAELANPGYVAYSLLGATSQERVPVVFLFQQNATDEIPAQFDLQINAY